MLKKNKSRIIISSIIILLPMIFGLIMWDTVFQEICRHEMLGDFSADNYLNLENLQKSS